MYIVCPVILCSARRVSTLQMITLASCDPLAKSSTPGAGLHDNAKTSSLWPLSVKRRCPSTHLHSTMAPSAPPVTTRELSPEKHTACTDPACPESECRNSGSASPTAHSSACLSLDEDAKSCPFGLYAQARTGPWCPSNTPTRASTCPRGPSPPEPPSNGSSLLCAVGTPGKKATSSSSSRSTPCVDVDGSSCWSSVEAFSSDAKVEGVGGRGASAGTVTAAMAAVMGGPAAATAEGAGASGETTMVDAAAAAGAIAGAGGASGSGSGSGRASSRQSLTVLSADPVAIISCDQATAST
mmetsp:Transcript_15876/g.52044  ORF Transcript_15876/g.52044 Transcript_15876/m.52044 type:complete len:298 (-) Transcript_15876:930-1823(-)